MKVSELIASVSQKDKNKALKLPVRELEQESKGHYVAFVDEGELSHDVQLFMQASKVTEVICDCANAANLCVHKVAVLLSMEGNKTSSKTKVASITTKKKKKLTETEEIMLRMDKDAMANWLTEVFKKNKPLEQLFLLTFSTEEKQYTVAQVQEIMEQTIKSVAGRRKTLEGANVKKLMDLMAMALEPVNQYVTVSINKPIANEIYGTVIETMNAFERRIRTYSKKIEGFYDGYISWFALTVNNIQDRTVWEEVIKRVVYITFEHVFDKNVTARTYNDDVVRQVYHNGTKAQKLFIADELVRTIKSIHVKRNRFDFNYVLFLKEVALDQGVYDEVHEFFAIDVFRN